MNYLARRHRFRWIGQIKLMRFCWSFLLTVGGLCAFGQMNTGEISGSVQDLSRSAIPGVTVVIELTETGQGFKTVSNGAGEYLIAQLPVGVYSLSVSAPNFKHASLRNIEVHSGDHLRRNFILQVGD